MCKAIGKALIIRYWVCLGLDLAEPGYRIPDETVGLFMFCSFGDVGPKYQGPRFVCAVLASIEL